MMNILKYQFMLNQINKLLNFKKLNYEKTIIIILN